MANLVAIVCSVVSALIVALVTRKTTRRLDEGDERREEEAREAAALRNGVRSLLRAEIVSAHRTYAEQAGFVTLEQREYLQRTFSAYRDLGGNDVGERLYNDLMALPTKEDRR